MKIKPNEAIYKEYQTARVEGFIPADQSFEEYLLAEVKRLREGILNVMAGIYDNMYDMNQALDRVILND